MTILLESLLPGIRENGLNTDENVVFGGTLAVTGAVTLTSTIGASAVSTTGALTARSGTAVPATDAAVTAVTMFSSGPSIYVTSDAPTHTAVKGSLCINTGGSSTSTRLYVNTDGGTTWTNFTSAA